MRGRLRERGASTTLLVGVLATVVGAVLLVALPLALTGERGGDEAARPPPVRTGARSDDGGGSVLPARQVVPLAEALPRRTTAPVPPTRLADGLAPPTNRWFSGLVFGDQPQPVFPLPLAFTGRDDGFGFGLPQVVVSPGHVVGSHQADVTVTVAGADRQLVVAHDDASFTLAHRSGGRDGGSDGGGEEWGRTLVAEGSPFVRHAATRAEQLTTSVAWRREGDAWTASTPTGTYALVVRGGTVTGRSIDLAEGGSAVFFPVPKGRPAAELAKLAHLVAGTSTSYEVGDDEVTTRLAYGDAPSAFVVMPVQAAGLADDVTCDLGKFESVYGDLPVCRGPALTWSVPRHRAAVGLDLDDLSPGERDELARQVADDVTTSPEPPDDTYFGGKWLYRMSQLLDLASRVGAEEAERAAAERLTDVLARWTDPEGCARRTSQCFVHDPAWQGVVGLRPSFGSEQFNDHHFHHGYFLYAAATLAAHDPAVTDPLRGVLDLLAADVAGGSDTGVTPRLRSYDVYAGHSWASGTAPFADGNNQESSSEAVTAWAGLALWAEATGDEALATHAAWLLSSEAAAARAYWVHPEMPDGYEREVVGISWGAKRDHATWFSAEPSAVLGIQLIPMSPSAGYLAGAPDRIRAAVAEAGGAGNDGPLGDYVLLYSALAGRDEADAAVAAARALPASRIDDALSRSYLLAYAMSRR